MSDAKKCDRCGNFYTLDISDEKNNVAGISLLDKYGRSVKKLYLCQTCRKKLQEWLDGPTFVQKHCDNCMFKNVGKLQDPCVSCRNYDCWKAR